MGMDEHDKRAREVRDALQQEHPWDWPATLASALRSTAAAAVAAERERCAKVCEEISTEEGETPGEALDRAADAIRAAPSKLWTENAERQLARVGGWHVPGLSASPAPLASPAQAERVSEEVREARPFHVGAEVEVIALPQRQEDGKWSRWVRTTITGGPHPHPGGTSTTWDVPLDCGYRFEDEMRWPSVLRAEADALEVGT